MSRVRTMSFDAVAAAAPLNREASVVRDGSGDLWAPKIKEHIEHWDAPPPPEAPRPEIMPDLTGRTVGRLTVIRYHGRRGDSGRWLVRCACGAYELRRSKAITNPKPRDGGQEHACAACDYLYSITWKQKHLGSGVGRKRADDALLDRLAAPKVCGPCKTPYTCESFQRCVNFQTEDAA